MSDDLLMGSLSVVHHRDGSVTLIHRRTNKRLHYDAAEWSAFVAGVRANEFDYGFQSSSSS